MAEVAAQMSGVTKRYGNKYAVNDMNLVIPAGRVVGVLGPNGSGKSTLFRMLTGLTWADRGDVRVLGRPPGWQTNRDIAYLPDRARWYPNHTVQRAFDWAQAFLPGFDRVTAERLATFMNLDMELRAVGMSRGQESRMMLTLCIARRVPLIILDEPFTGIDVMSRERIIAGLIDQVADTESTVLISTHEIQETESLFDYAVFLDDGRVALAGDADELRQEHGSMHTIMQNLYR